MKNKAISFFLVFVLIFTLIPLTASANESDFQIVNGILVKYTGSDENVTIPGTVSHIAESVFKGNTKIRGLVIPPQSFLFPIMHFVIVLIWSQ